MSTPEVSDLITSALQAWNNGQQQEAVNILRPQAEANERTAVLLLCWFLSQMGAPYYADGITFSRKAAELAMPQAGAYFFGNILSDPSFRAQAPELAQDAILGGWPLDPLPNALAALQQGDPATAVRLVEAAAVPRPFPEGWENLFEQSRDDIEAIHRAAGDVRSRRDEATSAIEESQIAVENRAKSLLDLIERLTTGQPTAYFDEEATAYGGEAKVLWYGGLAVLSAAVLAAATPLVIYYVDRATGRTPWLEGNHLVAAHTTFILALGAVAGVLLARARGRDRARQRARDLSVALQTMFAYSESISDPSERQLFIRESGRTVLEAFLRQDAPVDSDRSLLAALRTH
jgi:hypothetical protein